MTDRRTTITLNWRPAGEPARRLNDYAEVAFSAPAPTRPPEPPEPDRRDIGLRLENWGRAFRDERERAISPTAAFCDRARREALGDTSGVDDRRSLDEADAALIERAMRDLSTLHRRMLWHCYIKQESAEAICRKLSIPHKPIDKFVRVFREAQGAVELAAQQRRADERRVG